MPLDIAKKIRPKTKTKPLEINKKQNPLAQKIAKMQHRNQKKQYIWIPDHQQSLRIEFIIFLALGLTLSILTPPLLDWLNLWN